MNRQVIILSLWGIMLMVLTMTVCGSCRREKTSETPPLSEEEQRLAEMERIDSTLMWTFPYAKEMTGWMADSLARWEERLYALSAEAWVLVEDSTGLVISEKNARQRMYMASITKMMTCLLALERGRMDDSIQITEDVSTTRDARVKVGDGYTVGNLIREMMLMSDNVAAQALAKHIGGDTLTFYQMMNEKAAYLGMKGTHFANPNGMPNDSNYSTAADLLRLSRYCMDDTAFAAIVGTASEDIPLLDGRHFPCQNTNAMLENYDGCIGIKTGFTRQAGNCLVSAATRNGVTLYLVLLKSKSHTSRFSESATLLDYGFRVMQVYRQHRGEKAE